MSTFFKACTLPPDEPEKLSMMSPELSKRLGGQWIVDLRVVHLSGIWPQVYQAYLQAKILPEMGTQEGSREKKPKKAA